MLSVNLQHDRLIQAMTTFQDNTNYLHTVDGTRLFYRENLHPNPRGSIVMVHGLGEHSGRYGELAALFHALGLSVRMHDHRGHGRSEGPRGSVHLSDDYLTDLRLVFNDFAEQTGTTPLLFGHSLGGLIAARFATAGWSPVRALLLSSPALGLRMTLMQKLLLAISTHIAPALAVATSLPAHGLSHDVNVVREYEKDPFNHGKVAARVVNFMLEAIQHAMADAKQLTVPLLMQVAGDDALVEPAGSREFFDQVPEGAKEIHWYAGAYHEIFNEAPPYRQQAQDDLRAWLKRHV